MKSPKFLLKWSLFLLLFPLLVTMISSSPAKLNTNDFGDVETKSSSLVLNYKYGDGLHLGTSNFIVENKSSMSVRVIDKELLILPAGVDVPENPPSNVVVTCTGDCGCIISSTYDPSTGNHNITCTCQDCTMSVKVW